MKFSTVLRPVRGTLLFVSLLVVTTGMPVAAIVYFPGWYHANCHWHDRCERMGMDQASVRIGELVSFFRYRNDLPEQPWTPKETVHLNEVRRIMAALLTLFAASVLMLAVLWDRRRVRRLAVVNALAVVSASAVLPIFRYFWRNIFHALLFDNAYWINTPRDISYYITPRVFFFHSVVAVILAAALLNIGLFLLLRSRHGRQSIDP